TGPAGSPRLGPRQHVGRTDRRVMRLNRVLSNASLPAKLIVLLLLPSVGLVWLVGSEAVARRAEAQQTARLTNVVQLSVRLGNLVHEMQKERGLTAVFMSSHGTKLGPDLDAQRTKVDGRRTDLESFLAQRRGDLSRAI